MKKITLSAAILALTIMGCSDGLDNSVASASEVKDEQVQSLDEKTIALFKTTETCDGKEGSCLSIQTIGSHKYGMYFKTGVDQMNQGYSQASVWRDNDAWVRADFAHIVSACVQGCDDYGNCQHSVLKTESRPNVYFVNFLKVGVYTPGIEARCNSLSSEDGKISVVSVYSVVFNAGKYDEVILMGSTYANLSPTQAQWVYQKHIAAHLQNQ